MLDTRFILLRIAQGEIEQVEIYSLRLEDPVDFCFGHEDVTGWGKFSVVLLDEAGKIQILTPVIPKNFLLSEDEVLELKEELKLSKDGRSVREFMDWFRDSFDQKKSVQGTVYYEYNNSTRNLSSIFTPRLIASPNAGVHWSKVVVLDPNLGMMEGTSGNVTILRVSRTGHVELLSSFYPFVPTADMLGFLLSLSSVSVELPSEPFHVLQYNHVAFMVTNQTVHSIDFSSLPEFSNIIKSERELNAFLEHFTLVTKCYISKEKPCILGAEPLNHTSLGSGIMVFMAPADVKLVQIYDVLNPIDAKRVNAIKAKDEKVLSSFDADLMLNSVRAKIRKIFDQPELKTIDLNDKEKCQLFITNVRDEICDVHAQLFKISQELMGRMTLIHQLEEQLKQRMNYSVTTLKLLKTNFVNYRRAAQQCRANTEVLMKMSDRLQESVMNDMPQFSTEELKFRDVVDTAKRKNEYMTKQLAAIEEDLPYSRFQQSNLGLLRNESEVDVKNYAPFLREQQKIIKAMTTKVTQIKSGLAELP